MFKYSSDKGFEVVWGVLQRGNYKGELLLTRGVETIVYNQNE